MIGVFKLGIIALCTLMPRIVFAQVKLNSGHHYSWVEGARIGHDFGRNPWADSSESFDEIKSVEGVEEKVAKKIYNFFHE